MSKRKQKSDNAELIQFSLFTRRRNVGFNRQITAQREKDLYFISN